MLTAENLRTDLLELCISKLPIKGMILVTHNMEEAVLVCDRVLLSLDIRARGDLGNHVDRPGPRDRTSRNSEDYVDQHLCRNDGAQSIAAPTRHAKRHRASRCDLDAPAWSPA